MKLAIQQPYFIPYAGYFRLFAASDLFVIYDDVQFEKGGWIHRNKINGEWVNMGIKRPHLGTLIKNLEWKSPEKHKESPVEFLISTLRDFCGHLNIPWNVILSSELPIPKGLKGKTRVLWICQHLKAKEYINAPGGKALYNSKEFKKHKIKLRILSDYENKKSILQRLIEDGAETVRKEIYEHCTFK